MINTNRLAHCYRALYRKLQNSIYATQFVAPVEHAELCSFTAMEGIRYRANKAFRFMLVGWATNGWKEKRCYNGIPSEDDFVNSSVMNITNQPSTIVNPAKGRFEWIGEGNEFGQAPLNCFREGIDLSREEIESHPYHLKAQIWSYPKEVWCILAAKHGVTDVSSLNAWKKRWYDNIVWDNLYKIAPQNGGNPSDQLRKVQFEASAELLSAEIEYFNPTHILFATNYIDWFTPFNSHCFSNAIMPSVENKYVEAKGIYNGIKIVVSCRPDNRKAGYRKIEYVEAVVNAFEKG